MGCCTGSTFTTAPDATLDPLQRVNYTFGMVLGVDDFRQEQTYLMARDDRLMRELVGYGTIRGLTVTLQGQQVRVSPGMALMPDGRLVAVQVEQCADFANWRATEKLATPAMTDDQTVYVRLFAADASGSPVPIPGEPCRDESELSADARIADSFRLDFSLTAPDASEDLALRAVVAWIRAIKVRTAGVTLDEFRTAVQGALGDAIKKTWGDDPHAPKPEQPTPSLPGALPPPPADLRIPRAQLADYYAAAFDVWVQLQRTEWMAHHGPVPAAVALPERGLLLGAIEVKGTKAKSIRMLGRQQLLHLRLLQEWLLRDGSQDAPREAHFVLGKGDAELEHAQDLLLDFAGNDHAMTRIDIVTDVTDGGSGSKAVIVPAVKWPGGDGGGGPDYYGPGMSQPIPVADGGTGQNAAPDTGMLLVGRAASDSSGPAHFELGTLIGASLPKPDGSLPNIIVDATGEAPTIRLDTVQDIGPDASPTFANLTLSGDLNLSGDLAVAGQVHVAQLLTAEGGLVLADPLNSVLATRDDGTVIAARVWNGDEGALNVEPPTPYIYAPGQGDGEKGAAVRIEDGGTGLTQRPRQKQVLIGVESKQDSLRKEGGDYVLATLVDGKNTHVNLVRSRGGDDAVAGWLLSIDADGGGTATQVVAAGTTSAPASLTATSLGAIVTIDTVQPLHKLASPQFEALSLTGLPSTDAPDALIGWRKQDRQLVLTPRPEATDVSRWPMRYVSKPDELVYQDGDMVLAVLVAGDLKLPNPRLSRLGDGRILVVTNVLADKLSLSGLTVGRDGISIGLERGQSVTLASAASLPTPGWLIIGRG